MTGSNNALARNAGSKTVGAGSPWDGRRSGFGSVSCFGSEGNAGEFGSAFLVHAGHGMGAGLGQWTFQGGKTQLSRERDVHGAHVDACTVYLLRVLIMAAISP